MNIVIMGGGKVGESLARRILEGRRHEVRIIESDRARSLQLANALDVEIICGDGTNIDMLENAGVRDADCFIAISGDDANNLVASQLAKQYFGAKSDCPRKRPAQFGDDACAWRGLCGEQHGNHCADD